MAAVIPILALAYRGPNHPETWTVAAAALAVITSVISAWSSMRVVELQEDAQRPNPVPSFDLRSRYGLALFRVTNTGKTSAYNISLEWDVDLKDHHDAKIGFFERNGEPGISTLLPGESLSQIINVHHEFISRLPADDFSGRVNFCDSSGQKYKKNFRLNGKQYAGLPSHDDEWATTQFELQKLPKELRDIRQILDRLTK